MSGLVVATLLALGAAGLHATWNALLKTAPSADRDLASWGLFLVGAVVFAPVAVVLGGPGMAAVPWLALSGLLHLGYILLLVSAYQHGDFSLAYPLARGGGAVVGAVGGAVLLEDVLPRGAWIAVVVVVGGLIALVGRGVGVRPVRDALATGVMIGSYTLADTQGARASAGALVYGFSIIGVSSAVMSVWFLARGRGPALRAAWPTQWPRWLVGGACSAVAYAMVMVAVTQAPVGYVAVLRESSVVLGALIGWRLLKEPLGGRRLVASLVILAGMIGLIGATL